MSRHPVTQLHTELTAVKTVVVADYDTVVTRQAPPDTLCMSSIQPGDLIRGVVQHTLIAKQGLPRKVGSCSITGFGTVHGGEHYHKNIIHKRHCCCKQAYLHEP